ncbi:MAG: hypothetical protein P8L37_07190, partial [Phycisphaerales bacterium]|nr:hypothetical protein [Phycisphaerales bacterium]
EVPDDIRLVFVPESAELASGLGSRSEAVLKWVDGEFDIFAGRLLGSGYGHQFIVEERLLVRSMWTYFNLRGSAGERDCQLILDQEAANEAEPADGILLCSRGIEQASCEAVKQHFSREMEKLLRRIAYKDLADCIQPIRDSFPDAQEKIEELITRLESELMQSDQLEAVLLRELINWLETEAQAGGRTALPAAILKQHVNEIAQSIRVPVITLIAPPERAGWIDLAWGYKNSKVPIYRECIAQRVINRDRVSDHESSDPDVRRLVKDVLWDVGVWTDSKKDELRVDGMNVWDYNIYLDKFGLDSSSAQKPHWWPNNPANAYDLFGSQPLVPNRWPDIVPQKWYDKPIDWLNEQKRYVAIGCLAIVGIVLLLVFWPFEHGDSTKSVDPQVAPSVAVDVDSSPEQENPVVPVTGQKSEDAQ